MDDMAAGKVAASHVVSLFFFFHRDTHTRMRVGITGTCHRPCYLCCIILTFSIKTFQLREGMATVVGVGATGVMPPCIV